MALGYQGNLDGITWDELVASMKPISPTYNGEGSQEAYSINGYNSPYINGGDNIIGNPIYDFYQGNSGEKDDNVFSPSGKFDSFVSKTSDPNVGVKYINQNGNVGIYNEDRSPSWFDKIAPLIPIAAATFGAGLGAAGSGGAAEAAGGLGGGAFDLGGIAGGVEGAGGATGLGSTFGLGNSALPSTLSSEFVPSAGSASSNGGLSSLKDVGSALLKHPDLLATAGGLVNKLVGGGSSSDSGNGGGALAGMSGGWNPQQQQTANDYFSKSSARQVNPYDGNLARAPIEGGEHQWFKPMAEGGHVKGDMSGGQDDVVPIMGAHGEYMLDADTVSALGDGSTDAGIRKLDQFRKALREHKRSAPSHSIPPRALSITDYMRGK